MPKGYYSSAIVFNQTNRLSAATFIVETFRESRQLDTTKIFLLKNIDKIIEKSWGKFGKDFIIQHIVRANILKIVKDSNNLIAIAAASKKKLLGSDILYLEFTSVNEKYQGYNISTILNADLIVEEYFNGLFHRWFKPLDVITITRNPRVLGALSHFTRDIYPDPKKFAKSGELPPASERTWNLINEIIKQSWNPKRKILRVGNVLLGSYEDTPWLILPKSQRHYMNSVRTMAEKYLELKSKSDREFIVHARFGAFSVIKYFFWRRFLSKLKSSN